MRYNPSLEVKLAPAISGDEFDARVERLREGMRKQRLDAVLLGTGMNLQYFSGFPSPTKNVARPFFFIIAADREPILFTHTAFADECRHLSRVKDVRTYRTLSQAPLAELKYSIIDQSRRFGRVGMELGFEQSLDISPLEFQRLQSGLAPTELVDVSSLIWQLRMIKSEDEIACMRAACEFVAGCYVSTFRRARAGMNEREISRFMQHELHQSESDIFLVITSGEGNYDMISKPADDRIVSEGEMVWMDAGCRVNGYWSDYSRAATMGAPSALQEHAHAAIAEITDETIRKIRPGVKCSEVARFALDRLAALNIPITSSLAERAARIGHGIGLNMTEPPHLGLHDDTVLQPGMVVSVEPGVATRYGTFHIEENVVVREGECEILTTSPRALQIISI